MEANPQHDAELVAELPAIPVRASNVGSPNSEGIKVYSHKRKKLQESQAIPALWYTQENEDFLVKREY